MEQFQAKPLKLEPEEVTTSERPWLPGQQKTNAPGHRATLAPLPVLCDTLPIADWQTSRLQLPGV